MRNKIMEENKKTEESTLQYVSPAIMKLIQDLGNKVSCLVSGTSRQQNFECEVRHQLEQMNTTLRFIYAMLANPANSPMRMNVSAKFQPQYQLHSADYWRYAASNPGIAPDINPFANQANKCFEQSRNPYKRPDSAYSDITCVDSSNVELTDRSYSEEHQIRNRTNELARIYVNEAITQKRCSNGKELYDRMITDLENPASSILYYIRGLEWYDFKVGVTDKRIWKELDNFASACGMIHVDKQN